MSHLSNALNLTNVWFYLFAIVIVISALCVVSMRNIVHCAMFLACVFLGVAGIYVLLNADFLAAVQVLIYVGAITILILFAIMLSVKYVGSEIRHHNSQSIPAFVMILIFLVVFGRITARAWYGLQPEKFLPPGGMNSTQIIGISLLRVYALPFEIASIILLVAMIGAIIIARKE